MAVWIAEKICKGCGICVYRCPKGVLGISDRRNAKGVKVIEAVNPKKMCCLRDMRNKLS